MRFSHFTCRLNIFIFLIFNLSTWMISVELTTSSEPPSCPFILTQMILLNYVSYLLMYTFFLFKKWKNLMIKSLAAVSGLSYADKDLVHDLMFIIKNIAEDKFVQAILSFQPFKPKFRPMKFLDLESKKSCMGSTATNEESCFSTPRTKLRKDDSILERGSIIIKRKNSVKKEPRTC